MGIGHGKANMLNPINIIKGRMGEWAKIKVGIGHGEVNMSIPINIFKGRMDK